MNKSNIVALIVVIVVAGSAITYSLVISDGVLFAPTKKPNCYWVVGYFNPVGDPNNVSGGNCQFRGDNYDPFYDKGSIIVGGRTYQDDCTESDGNYLNEYHCAGTNGMVTYGYCTAGCKDTRRGGACKEKIRICDPNIAPDQGSDVIS